MSLSLSVSLSLRVCVCVCVCVCMFVFTLFLGMPQTNLGFLQRMEQCPATQLVKPCKQHGGGQRACEF